MDTLWRQAPLFSLANKHILSGLYPRRLRLCVKINVCQLCLRIQFCERVRRGVNADQVLIDRTEGAAGRTLTPDSFTVLVGEKMKNAIGRRLVHGAGKKSFCAPFDYCRCFWVGRAKMVIHFSFTLFHAKQTLVK